MKDEHGRATTENMLYEYLVNKTDSKAFSPNQTLPKVVEILAVEKDITILDFGAGKDAYGTIYLRDRGFDCTAYEIGINFVPGIHDDKALTRKYDVVFASNVLNVQPTEKCVIEVLLKIQSLLLEGGMFVCNFPTKPRHNGMTTGMIESVLRLGFRGGVSRVINSSPAWRCRYEK
jgi:hypothetical protein